MGFTSWFQSLELAFPPYFENLFSWAIIVCEPKHAGLD